MGFRIPVEINLIGISFFLGSVISFSVGLFVLLKNTQSNINRSYFLITLMGSIWLFAYSLISLTTSPVMARWILRLNYLISVPYLSPSVYLFTLFFTGKEFKLKTATIPFLFGFIVSILCSFGSETLFEINKHSWGYFNRVNNTPQAWALFSILMLHFSVYSTLGFRNLFTGMRQAKSPQEKAQKKIFLIGALIGYIGALDFVVTMGFEFFPPGPFAFTSFCLLVAYGILKYQLFDVKLAIRKFTLLIGIYICLAVLLVPLSKVVILNLSLQPGFNLFQTILWMSLLIGFVLSLGPFIYTHIVRNSIWLRGTMATGLTHELKSPLGVLQGTIDMLKDQIASSNTDKDKSLDYLEMAQKNLTRLDSTVKNLLNVAKIQDEHFLVEKKEADLVKIIHFILDINKTVADKKGTAIQYVGPEELVLSIDYEKMEQAISNIVTNALKFSEGGTISVTLTESNNRIQLNVADQGAGISPKDLPKVFDRFYQAKPNVKGSGIGLTIAKAWVEAHGGKIWAESEGEGKGTTVSFTLPMNS